MECTFLHQSTGHKRSVIYSTSNSEIEMPMMNVIKLFFSKLAGMHQSEPKRRIFSEEESIPFHEYLNIEVQEDPELGKRNEKVMGTGTSGNAFLAQYTPNTYIQAIDMLQV